MRRTCDYCSDLVMLFALRLVSRELGPCDGRGKLLDSAHAQAINLRIQKVEGNIALLSIAIYRLAVVPNAPNLHIQTVRAKTTQKELHASSHFNIHMWKMAILEVSSFIQIS